MRTSMRACSGAAVALGIVVGPVMLASAAGAAPYVKHPVTRLSTGHVPAGGALTVSGAGWKDTRVEVDLVPSSVLGIAAVAPDGTFSANFTIPAGLSCHVDVITRGLTSGAVTHNELTIGNCSTNNGKEDPPGKGKGNDKNDDKADHKAGKPADNPGKGDDHSAAGALTKLMPAPLAKLVPHGPAGVGSLAFAGAVPVGGIALLRKRRH